MSTGAAGAFGSLLSAPDFAAITSVGFHPVGTVQGAAVVHLGYVSRGGKCSSKRSSTAPTDLAADTSGPFNLLLRKRYGVRHQALSRAIEECRALGGDGIVGLSLRVAPFPAGGTAFTVQGVAVRARTDVRPAALFTSHVSAPEFARLLRSGWVPTTLVFGIALGARHHDLRTREEMRRTATGEVRSYTRLINDTRRDARSELQKAVAGQGADGVVVAEMTLHLGERECPAEEGAHDLVAEAAILGTTVVAFERPPATGPAPLTIMRLDSAAAAAPATGDASPRPDSEQEAEPEGGFLDRIVASWSARAASRSRLSSSDSAGISKKAD